MASHSLSSPPIHFFKVILKTNLQSIMVPSKFIGRYGGGLQNPVFLKPPRGKEWKVCWTKRDNEVWFEKGWEKFASFYSLDEGHLVLFKYDGTSQFDVHIFDKSALEIDYPLSKDASGQKDNLDNLIHDEIDILDELPPNQKARHKTQLASPRPNKKMRSITYEDVEKRNSELQNLQVGVKTKGGQFQGTEFQKSTNGELKFCRQESEEDIGARIFTKSTCLNSTHTRKKALAPVKKIRAFDSASSFKSENPFFMVVMQPAYVSRKYYLVMPPKFAKKHLKKECGVVQLETLDGRTWPATYKIPRIRDGWKEFVMENGLKVGNVCVFELIDCSFKVHIFRDEEEGYLKVNPIKKEQISSMQLTPLEKASSFKSENPHFMVKMTHAYCFSNSNLHVPLKFAKSHLRNRTKSAKLLVQDVAWPVGYVFRRNSVGGAVYEISWGWKQFRKDNDLKVDDVCVFELVPGTESTFQVTIFRATQHPVHSTVTQVGAGSQHKSLLQFSHF